MPKKLSQKELEQRRQRLNEIARNHYYDNREELLKRKRKQYHTNARIRQHKLDYAKRYREKNLRKILDYQIARRARIKEAKAKAVLP